jgi:hypothetical protein
MAKVTMTHDFWIPAKRRAFSLRLAGPRCISGSSIIKFMEANKVDITRDHTQEALLSTFCTRILQMISLMQRFRFC